MKSVISITIDTRVLSECSKYNINRSAICEEALRLATLYYSNKEIIGTEGAIANFLNNKIVEANNLKKLSKLHLKLLAGKDRGEFQTNLIEFCSKNGLKTYEVLDKIELLHKKGAELWFFGIVRQ